MAENYFGITDTGRQRENNEDTFIASSIVKDRFIAAGVIDGVGGYKGGEVAADIAKHALLDYFKKTAVDVVSMLGQAILSANQKILIEKQKVAANNKMACVLTVVLVEKKANKFYYAHVGDTRLYLFRDNSLVKLTRDHSFVGLLEDTGRLNEEAAMTHPKRNEINKALGFEAPIVNVAEYIETGESPFLPGDLLLLCSDGLTDMINKADITAILSQEKTLEEKGKELIDAANDAGGKDNITVVLVQNDRTPVKYAATKSGLLKKNKINDEENLGIEKNESNNPLKKSYSKNLLIFFLSLIALLSAGAFLWERYWKPAQQNISNEEILTGAKVYDQTFQDTINNSTEFKLLLSDSLFGSKIFLQDTVFINKDSIQISGDINTTITSDTSSEKRLALYISPSVKYVLFNNLTIQNANIIINAQNMDVLHFQEVQFKDAQLFIVNSFQNASFSGSIKDIDVAVKDSSEKVNQ
ncbi:MAG: protein phosphatase 2C domain-containing protein [Chitinophagaceae bacterium]